MADPAHDTIAEAIDALSRDGIRNASENGRQYTNMTVDELIKADQYAKSKTSAGKAHFGLRMTKCVPPAGG